MDSILFICTGNYYRSRFAEALFNHLAKVNGLEVRAFSRGLATHLITDADGHLSPHTEGALAHYGVDREHTAERPVQLSLEDFGKAGQIIALREREHRPMMERQFPEWSDKISYWHVEDIDEIAPADALPRIHDNVHDLIRLLVANRKK